MRGRQGHGRTYPAVIGVTVGMLFAGLAVPMAFGRLPTGDSASTTIVQTLADGGSVLPGEPGSGAAAQGGSALLPNGQPARSGLSRGTAAGAAAGPAAGRTNTV